ncbi:hypothetical protein BGX38DRAFT_1268340 [Terfezia claveryi]|nr:hypothetical protein BGX38DRAFT_1268340 [Terfezia claveryi]
MANPQTIAILGPTGIQGASVLHYLLRSPSTTFNLRAITTRPDPSPSLPSLSAHPNLSVHHLPSPTSIPHLTQFFTGCTAVFGNTNTHSPVFDGKPDSPTEIGALKAIVDAAVEAKVGLLVLSCLPDVGELGKRSSDFLNKAEGMRYAKERARETGLRVVYVQLGWYMQNFVEIHDAKVNPVDGVVEFQMQGLRQDKRVPWVSTYTDLGPIIKALLYNPDPYIGKEIPIVAELLTMDEIANRPTLSCNLPPLPPSPEQDEWAGLIGLLNKEAYLVGEKVTELCTELIRKERPDVGMTGWRKWIQGTGFDVKKKEEGYSQEIRKQREKWGGRKFF